MSQENVDLVLRIFDEFSRGGPDAMINAGFWAPDIVWDFTTSGIPGLGVYRGHDEARSFFEEEWFGVFPFDDWEVEVEEVIDHGDRVIVIARQVGRGASSGATTGLEFVQTYSLRDSQIVRVETYLDRQKAMGAAGLAE